MKALDAKYFPYAQISDGLLPPDDPPPAMSDPGTRAIPGEGKLPLHELLAALPKGIPLSVELPHDVAPKGTSARDWAKITLDRTHRFLEKAH